MNCNIDPHARDEGKGKGVMLCLLNHATYIIPLTTSYSKYVIRTAYHHFMRTACEGISGGREPIISIYTHSYGEE